MGRRAQFETADLPELQREYLRALVELDQAAAHMRAAMDNAEAALSLVRKHLEGGGRVSDFADSIHPAPRRAQLSAASDGLERARHKSQKVLFRLLLAEGKSMTDIARVWGISRQLVSRLINEPDAVPPGDSP